MRHVKKIVEDYLTNGLNNKCLNALNIKDDSFNDLIIELYARYCNQIKDNVKKLSSGRVRKDSLRIRTLAGLLYGDKKLACGKSYSELHPIFYVFGLILPHLTNIVESDLCNAFMTMDDGKQVDESSTLLLKTIMMSDVKLLDDDDLALSHENKISVLILVNIILHAIVHSLFKIGADDLPKLVETSLLEKLDNVLDMKLQTPAIVDKFNDNDSYIAKVFRKFSLLFGKRTVSMKMKAIPIGTMLCDSIPPVNAETEIPDIEDYVDSFVVKYENLSNSKLQDEVGSEKHFSIEKALKEIKKIISIDNKYYTAQFKTAHTYLPVFINRRDSTLKKEYARVLMSKVSKCCSESKINEIEIVEKHLFEKVNVDGDYYPLVIGGTFKNDNVDDVDFIYVLPISDEETEVKRRLLNYYDKLYFCDDPSKALTKGTMGEPKDFSEFVQNNLDKELNRGCCDLSKYNEFNEDRQTKYLLFTSNKNCNTPLVLEEDQHNSLKKLIAKSASFVLYITESRCE